MDSMQNLRNVVTYNAGRRYLEKRAAPLPLIAAAFGAPSAVSSGIDTYRDAVMRLENANSTPLGHPVYPAKHAAEDEEDAADKKKPETFGSSFMKGKNPLVNMFSPAIAAHLMKLLGPKPGFMERKDIGASLGQAAVKAFGTGMSTAGVDLLKDMAAKAMHTAQHAGDNAARQAILKQLKMEDSVLADADDKLLMEAYHTMVRFAPTLSTDKNAVRNFLREAVMTGSGPNFATIKMLGETERTVTGQGRGDR